MSENFPSLHAGFGALDGGINAQPNHSVASPANPNGLEYNQAAFAINCSFRGGIGATHRPVFMRRDLIFPDEPTLAAFGPSGLFQRFTVHASTQGSIIACVSGRQFQVAVEDNFKVRELTIPGDANAGNRNFSWFVQAGPFTVINDGEAKPLFFDGSKLRRAKDNELKPGTAMAYSQGRIWYATYDQYGRVTHFRAGDLIGNAPSAPGQPGGTPEYDYQDSVLQETENLSLNEGGDFSGRSDMGEIRAMIVPRMLDTSLGQGPLQVMCERGSLSCNAPVDRTTWKNLSYPIETESQFDYGPMGADLAVNANGDVIYRSSEGFNSWKAVRADFQNWVNVGISMEVDEIIQGDPEPLLQYGSAVLFDSRFLSTTMPRPTPGGIVHDGLVALDMNLIATLRKRDNPAWEGLWTGLAILQIRKGTFANVERCFAFARTIEGRIELWEILPSASGEIWDNAETPIVWSFETPAYDYNTAQDMKRLLTGAIWQSDIQETVEFLVQWRPDQYPCYVDWHAWSECAPVRQCSIPRCGTPRNLRPQYRTKVRLPQPPDICNPTTRSMFRDGCEHQFRIQVTGHAQIRKMRFAAQPLTEPFFDGCPLAGPCLPLECCSPDPIQYSSAPFHNDGSKGQGPNPYPYIMPEGPGGYPTGGQPHPYPYHESPPPPWVGIPEITNPPPTTTPIVPHGTIPGGTPPTTITLPGLPPVALLPNPDAPPLTGNVYYFYAVWTCPPPPPVYGDTFQAGAVLEPPEGLQDGTLAAWAAGAWARFSQFVVENALVVTQAQIEIVYLGDEIGEGATRRWFADPLFQTQTFIGSFGLGWTLEISYIST